MDPTLLALASLVAIVALMLVGVPIGYGMGIVGFIGVWLVNGFNPSLTLVGFMSYVTTASFTFSVIPLFFLIGSLVFYAGASEGLYNAAFKWLGRLPGGLGVASIFGCAGFAAVCGSTSATALAIGKVAIPEMEKYGYNKAFSAACLAAGGTLGVLIPPSIPMVVYSGLTDVSLGKLLLSGFIPGIIGAVAYSLLIIFVAMFRPVAPRGMAFSWKERFLSLNKVWGILFIAAAIMGTIYTGVATPTEAGAIGSFAALCLLFISGRFSRSILVSSLRETAHSSCSIFTLLIGALIYSKFLATTMLPLQLSRWIIQAGLPPFGLLIMVVLLLTFLGCFIDPVSMQVLVVPLIFPAMVAAGFDPIWFGIIMVRMVEIAVLTPPLGMNVFVINSVVPGVGSADIFRSVMLFVMVDLITLILFAVFPNIILFVPKLMS